jgi:hypothetical protein
MGFCPHCGVGWPGIPGSAPALKFCCSCGKQLLFATDRSITDNQSKEKDSCESPALTLLAKEATQQEQVAITPAKPNNKQQKEPTKSPPLLSFRWPKIDRDPDRYIAFCIKLADQLLVNNPFIAGRKNERTGAIGTNATWELFCNNVMQDPDFVRPGYTMPTHSGIQRFTESLVKACQKRQTQTGDHDAMEYPNTLVDACQKIDEFKLMSQEEREKRIQKEERDKIGGTMLQNAAFQCHKKKNQNEKSRARHELGIDDASDDDNGCEDNDDDDDNDDGDYDDGAPLTATGAFFAATGGGNSRKRGRGTKQDPVDVAFTELMQASKKSKLAKAASEQQRAEARLIKARTFETMMKFMTERMGNDPAQSE